MTPAAALVNLSQTAIVGLPVLSAKHGLKKSAAALGAASKEILGKGGMEAKLKGDELKAFKEFMRAGVIDKTQAHDLAGIAEEGGEYSPTKRKVMGAISFLFHKAEQYNREITAMAAYRLARADGKSHDVAVLHAEDMVWDSHFDYSNANRPRYLQNNLAKVALLFKQHSLNMSYRLWRDFHEMFRGASPELKKEARTRFAGILGMTAMFAGVSGMPLLWAVQVIGNALGGDDDEPYDFMTDVRVTLAEATSPKIAEAIMKGPIDAMTGLTVSSRVSLNNLWLRESNRDLEGMLPKAGKDMAKALRYLDEGALNYRGDAILDREDINAWEITAQLIGFTPAELTLHYEQNNAIKKAERKILDRRSYLMNQFNLALRFDDGDLRDDVMEKIAEFNGKYPNVQITKGGLMRSRKQRLRYSKQTLGGINVNKKMRGLKEDLNFSE